MLKLGVIGYGKRISGVIQHELRRLEPDARVVAVVDPDEAGARSRLAECDQSDVVFYDTVEEMVRKAKLDAVLVGTRCNLHAPYGIEMARYDLPLFLEKPVAISMEQAVGLERAFENSRCEVVVSFPLRVSPLCCLARQYLAEGAVGTPEHVLAVNYVPYGTVYWDAGYRDYEITQGLFLQKATHDFDYMAFLMDSPIVRVAAMASWGRVFGGKKPAGLTCGQCDEAETCLESPRNRRRNLSGGTQADHPCTFGEECGSPETGMNEDSSSALVEFASGAKGVYTQVFYARRDAATRGATVSGYLGTVSFDWYTNELKRVRHHAPFSDTVKGGQGLGHFGGDTALMENFLDVIHGRARSRTPIQMGIQSVYACLAAKESAETGRFMDVRQLG
ncbi:MAG TPA: Gfo/Idh/MocA family oxidoreductase [Armatimonadetes bacterium]|nr:Gfo/Idh/MocA family oxidoreductase [Armatimonadota bacterium]